MNNWGNRIDNVSQRFQVLNSEAVPIKRPGSCGNRARVHRSLRGLNARLFYAQNVQPAAYWSATVFARQPGFTIEISFAFVPGSDAPIGVNDANIGGAPKHVWAVRGGSQGPVSY